MMVDPDDSGEQGNKTPGQSSAVQAVHRPWRADPGGLCVSLTQCDSFPPRRVILKGVLFSPTVVLTWGSGRGDRETHTKERQ